VETGFVVIADRCNVPAVALDARAACSFPAFALLRARFCSIALATGAVGAHDEVELLLACITVAFARLLWTRWSYVFLFRFGFLFRWEGTVLDLARTIEEFLLDLEIDLPGVRLVCLSGR